MILTSTGVNLSPVFAAIFCPSLLPSQHVVACDTRYAGLPGRPTFRRPYRVESGLKGKNRSTYNSHANSQTHERYHQRRHSWIRVSKAADRHTDRDRKSVV